MGGKGGSTGTSTQYSGVQIPQEVLQRYNKATDRAEDVSKQTWANYGGEFVAPVNATQMGGYNTMMGGQAYTNAGWEMPNASINQGVNAASPLLDQASGSINTGQAQGQALGAAGLGQAAEAYGSAQPFNTAAAGGFGNAMAGAQPYNQAATNLSMQGMQGVDPSQLNTQQFMNPYQQQVIEATMGQLGQQQAQQRMDQRGSMIREGSFGGDRSGIANANMVNQQNLATGSVLSNLNSQNYGQALAAAQQQQGVGLGAAQANRAAIQQGAGQMLGIGAQGYQQGMGYGTAMQGLGNQQYQQGMGQAQYTGQMGQQMYGQGVGAGQAQQGLGAAQYGMWGDVAAKQAALAGQAFGQNMQTAQGQIGFGSLQQQTQQAQDSALYNQWMQERGYPFQTSQFYTNAVMGTGPLSGSNAYSGSFTPQPFFSDERLKENMEPVGTTHDGQVIYRFNYKGQPGSTQLGLSAQEVERKHPEAVTEHRGAKAVYYKEATDDAAERPHKAAGGPLGSDPFGYQPPDPGLPPGVGVLGQPASMPTATPTTGGSIGDIVALQRASLAANAPGSGPPSNAGSAEALGTAQNAANANTAAAGPMAGMGGASTAAPGGPAAAGGANAVYPTSFTNPMDGGSANGATGAAGAGSSQGGDAGTVGASVGGDTGTEAGASAGTGTGGNAGVGGGSASDSADSGTWATGGRVGYAKAGKVPAYGGGLGGSDDFWAQQAAAQHAAYGDLFPRGQTSGGVGNASILGNIQPAKASTVLKPPESKTPAPAAKATTDQATDALDTVSKGAKSIDSIYNLGKDALVGSKEKGTPQRGDPGQGTPAVGKQGEPGYIPASKDYRPASVDYRPASSDYKPATGGLIGHGGSRSKPGWIDKQLEKDAVPADKAADVKVASRDEAMPDGRQPWDEKVDYKAEDLGPSIEVADSGSMFADAASDSTDLMEDVDFGSMFAKRGGRIKGLGRARFETGGETKTDEGDMPFSGQSVLPGGSYNQAEASDALKPPDPAGDKGAASGKKKSSGAGKAIGAVVGGIAGSFVGCTMCGAALGGLAGGAAEGDYAKDGGRIEGRLCNRCAAGGKPVPRTKGNLPPPREMPYPEDSGREIEPELYTTQPWGAYTKSLPGARDEYADGGVIAPPAPGLGSAVADVHYGIFSRSGGHKMVDRAPTRDIALTLRDKHGSDDHFVKPISPARAKRWAGGRAGFDIGGTIEDEEQARLDARAIEDRDLVRLPVDRLERPEGPLTLEPVDRSGPSPDIGTRPAGLGAAAEPTPAAAAILEGMKRPGLAGADPGTQVAEAATTTPVVPTPQEPPIQPDTTGLSPTAPVMPKTETPDLVPAKPGGVGTATTAPPPPPPVATQTPQQQQPPPKPPAPVPDFDPSKPHEDRNNVIATTRNEESRVGQWNQDGTPVRGSKGEIGHGQFLPATAQEVAKNHPLGWRPDLFYGNRTNDPAKNAEIEKYNRDLTELYIDQNIKTFGGDTLKAAAAYNAGPGTVKAAVDRATAAGRPQDWWMTLPMITQNRLYVVSGGKIGVKGQAGQGGGGGGGGGTQPTAGTGTVPTPTAAGLGGASSDSKSMYGENKDWWDRNESWTLPALHGIGKMLSSQSRTLAGSIGEGLAGGTEQYMTRGQRQQSVDIQKQQQDIAQVGKLQEMINMNSREKAGILLDNVNADVSAYDRIDAAMKNKMYGLLKVMGGGGVIPPQHIDWLKTQPAEIQDFTLKARQQDNPWVLYRIAAGTQDPNERARIMGEAKAAADRAASGPVMGKDGNPITLSKEMVNQLMQMRTRQAEAQAAGSPDVWTGQLAQAQNDYDAWAKNNPNLSTPELQAKDAEFRKRIADLQAKIRSGGGGGQRAMGGRVGRADGGPLMATDLKTDEQGQVPVEIAQAPSPASEQSELVPSGPGGIVVGRPGEAPATPPKPAVAEPKRDEHDAGFWYRHAQRMDSVGNTAAAENARGKAKAIEAKQLETAVTTESDAEGKPVFKYNPQVGEAKERENEQKTRAAVNQKLLDEAYRISLAGRQAEQQYMSAYNQMFDEKTGKARMPMGPATEGTAKVTALLGQFLPEQLIKDLTGLDPANKVAYDKAIAGIAQAMATSAVGSRPTEDQVRTFMQTAVPNMGMPEAAAKFLFEHALLPKAKFDKGMYAHIAGLDPVTSNYRNELHKYSIENNQILPGSLRGDSAGASPDKPMPMPADIKDMRVGQAYEMNGEVRYFGRDGKMHRTRQ